MGSKPRATEHQIQAAIVKALQLAGLTVYETTAYRQKGASGVDRGIPDLLVCAGAIAPYTFIGLEVKRRGNWRWSSIEQERAFEARHFALVYGPEDALEECRRWFAGMGGSTQALKCKNVLNALEGER